MMLVLECVSVTEKHHFTLLLAKSNVELAKVMLEMNLKESAVRVLELVDLCNEDVVTVGRYWQTFGECYVDDDFSRAISCYLEAAEGYSFYAEWSFP